MFTQTTSSNRRRRHGLRGRALLAACVAAAAMGAAAGTATAANTTTKWSTIDQQPASAASPAQFLTATSTGQVTLDRYKSGEWRQQWAPVYPEWPESPSITSNSPLSDFFETFAACITEWGCPFSGNVSRSPRKYVNRMYAMCLTFKPTGSVTTRVSISRCGRTSAPKEIKSQVFTLNFSDYEMANGIPRTYTPVFGTRGNDGRCLDSAGGGNTPGVNAAALDCGTPANQTWRQQFRFLESDRTTCKRYYPGTVCGLGAPVQ